MNAKKKLERKLYPRTYRGNRTEQTRRYRRKHRLKYEAQWAISRAIRLGKIIRPDVCSMCGDKGMIVAHHHDYEKQFDVIWVCYDCHNKIHSLPLNAKKEYEKSTKKEDVWKSKC